MLSLSHFSDEPITSLHNARQGEGKGGFMKPNGLWLSVDGDDDWPAWCAAENFRDISKQYHYRVSLASKHRVLHICNENDMRRFDTTYKGTGHPSLGMATINWSAVAADFRGIIIAPYQWGLRLEPRFFWYYGWDCASGVIWDMDAIDTMTLIRPPGFAEARKRFRRNLQLKEQENEA